MLMTSPLAVTLGISLTIPLAMAGDIYRGTQLGGWKIYLGGALVLVSFVANGLMDLASTEDDIEVEAAPIGRRMSSSSRRTHCWGHQGYRAAPWARAQADAGATDVSSTDTSPFSISFPVL